MFEVSQKLWTLPLLCNFFIALQRVSSEEAIALSQLREERIGGLKYLLKDKYVKVLTGSIGKVIRKEAYDYGNDSASLMRNTSAEDIKNFDLSKLSQEFRDKLPVSMSVVEALCQPRVEGTIKTHQSLEPVLTTVMAKCLGVVSDKNSLYRYVYSTVLQTGGAPQTSMNQSAKVDDAMSGQTRDLKQQRFVELFESEYIKWRESAPPDTLFQITLDNVDKFIRRRHSDKSKPNVLKHMVQAIAYRDNVPTVPYVPPKLTEITGLDLLPTEDDMNTMIKEFANIICDIWARHFPDADWMESRQHKHRYTDFARKKTSKVGLL